MDCSYKGAHEIKFNIVTDWTDTPDCRHMAEFIHDVKDVTWSETERPVKQSSIIEKVWKYATENSGQILGDIADVEYWRAIDRKIDEMRGK